MSELTDLVARAVTPAMDRPERERVYDVVRQAVLRLQAQQGLDRDDPNAALQRHLIEETIRDVEFDIVRFQTMEKIRRTKEAQDAEQAARSARRR